MGILQTVKGCPLFYELYDKEILDIVNYCRVINLGKGESVFKMGDEGNEVFLILSGSAKVVKNGVELATLRRGDLFGEMVLLKDNKRNADIITDTFTDVLMIDYTDIFGYFKEDPKIFSILMLNLARMLATRLKGAGETIERIKKEQDKKAA